MTTSHQRHRKRDLGYFELTRETTVSFLLAPVPLRDGLLHVAVGLQVAQTDRRLVRATSAGAPIPKTDLSVTVQF